MMYIHIYLPLLNNVAALLTHPQGFFKVLGKGKLPDVPLVVKAKYFSKDVSTRLSTAYIRVDWDIYSLMDE